VCPLLGVMLSPSSFLLILLCQTQLGQLESPSFYEDSIAASNSGMSCHIDLVSLGEQMMRSKVMFIMF
jgi:hypothetical protein